MGAASDILMKLVLQGLNPAEAQRIAGQSLGSIEAEVRASMARQVEAHRKASEAQTQEEIKAAKQQISEHTKKTKELIRAMKEVERETERAAKSGQTHWRRTLEDLENISTVFLALKSSISTGIGIAAGFAGAFKKVADEAERVGNVYGSRGGQDLKGIQGVFSAGDISGFDLASARTKQLVGDLELTKKEFGDVATAASTLADAMGTDATQALDTMMSALETGRTKTLALMGVMVNADDATIDYAASLGKFASELTDNEKKLALQKAMLEKYREAAKNAEGETGGLKDVWGELKTTLQNVNDQILAIIGNSKALGETLAILMKPVVRGAEVFAAFAESIKKFGLLSTLDNPERMMQEYYKGINAGYRKALDEERKKATDDAGKAAGLSAFGGELGDSKGGVFYRKPDIEGIFSKRKAERGARSSEPTGVDAMIAEMLAAREEASASAGLARRMQEDSVAETEYLFSQIPASSGVTDQQRLLGADSASAATGAEAALKAQKEAVEKFQADLRERAGGGLLADLLFTEDGHEKFVSDLEYAKQSMADLSGLVGDAGEAMAGAIGSALTSAIADKKSFSEAIKQGTRDVLKAMSTEAFTRAAMETAYGFAALATGNPVMGATAAGHFKAAAAFAAVGGLAAVGARSISVPSSASTSAVPTSRSSSDFSRPTTGGGSSDRQDTRPVNIYVDVRPGGEAEAGRAIIKSLEAYKSQTGRGVDHLIVARA